MRTRVFITIALYVLAVLINVVVAWMNPASHEPPIGPMAAGAVPVLLAGVWVLGFLFWLVFRWRSLVSGERLASFLAIAGFVPVVFSIFIIWELLSFHG
jgi:hypothetical protein